MPTNTGNPDWKDGEVVGWAERTRKGQYNFIWDWSHGPRTIFKTSFKMLQSEVCFNLHVEGN